MNVQGQRTYNENEGVRRCRRCVLPDYCPNIRFDENGICNVCHDFDRQWGHFKQKDYLESKKEALKKKLDSYRQKGKKYDCLVPISGGLDSTYVLYVCKKLHNMRTLAFNFDNGLQTEFAKKNLINAVTELGVDLITYRPNWNLQKKLYAVFFRKTGEFCTPCNVGIRSLSYKFAKELGIPLIVSGASPRTEVQVPRGAQIYHWSTSYFKEVIRGEISFREASDYLHIPENPIRVILSRISARLPFIGGIQTLHLPSCIEWDPQKILEVLKSEVKWQHSPEEYHHIDCIMEPMRLFLRQKKWGLSAALKYGTLVRNRLIDREQALEKMLHEEAIASKEPDILEDWLRLLDLSRRDLNGFEERSQLPYIPNRTYTDQRLLEAFEWIVQKVFRRVT